MPEPDYQKRLIEVAVKVELDLGTLPGSGKPALEETWKNIAGQLDKFGCEYLTDLLEELSR